MYGGNNGNDLVSIGDEGLQANGANVSAVDRGQYCGNDEICEDKGGIMLRTFGTYYALIGMNGKIRRLEKSRENAYSWVNTLVGQIDLKEIVRVEIKETEEQ